MYRATSYLHKLKQANAENILSQLGISPSNAIQMLYSQIVLQKGMPFELKLPSSKPLAVGAMTREQLDAGFQKGVDCIKARKVYSADALDDLCEICSYISNELLVPETATAQLSSIRKEVRSLDFMPARYALAPCHNHGT